MTLWTFLAIFFGGAYLLEAYYSHNKTQRKLAESAVNNGELDALKRMVAEQAEENQALRARIETLEAIVTDGGFEVDQQIRNLG
ncbi:hypothetical protein [Ferrimonas pelagia]|uniref:Phage shock protein B n=1 Tax=Ferrimonas pelagia TaxID=1177826 RepID=A0ABP9ENF1_9GAMM